MTENQNMQVILHTKPLQKQTHAWLLKPTSSFLADPKYFKEKDYYKHFLSISAQQFLLINQMLLNIPSW